MWAGPSMLILVGMGPGVFLWDDWGRKKLFFKKYYLEQFTTSKRANLTVSLDYI